MEGPLPVGPSGYIQCITDCATLDFASLLEHPCFASLQALSSVPEQRPCSNLALVCVNYRYKVGLIVAVQYQVKTVKLPKHESIL